MGFARYTLFFLFLLPNRDFGYLLDGSNEYPESIFEQKYETYQKFLSEIFHIFGRKILSIFE